jgi:hypothetical protein
LHEHHGHVAAPYQRWRTNREKESLLDALAGVHEVRKFLKSVALPTISPLVVHKEDVEEGKAVLLHEQEKHTHGARPSHESDELIGSQCRVCRKVRGTDQVDLEEESPVCKTVRSRVSWFSQHEICRKISRR